MTNLNDFILSVVVFSFCLATAIATSAQTFKTLVNFDTVNGFEPAAVLAQNRDGKLYGTTFRGGIDGGINGLGTVFDVNETGVLTTTVSFPGTENGPAGPGAGLVLSNDGNFLGTTDGGGDTESGVGTIFKVTPEGILTVLYAFCPRTPCIDGADPAGTLVHASDGNFYGTTVYGGTNGEGTVFRITPAGVLAALHSFDDSGADPTAGLIQATDGNLYGTTSERGNNTACPEGCGTVYKITLRGKFTTIHQFAFTDGAHPVAGLVEGSDGALYGVTPGGGTGCVETGGCGTVFRILNGKFQVVHNFHIADGAYPWGNLVQGNDGLLYGTTRGGGDVECTYPGGVGCGTLFAISRDGALTTLHKFDGSDGNQPISGLTQATNGTFYGTTFAGGSDSECFYGCGTLFSLDLGLPPFVTFVRFAGRVGHSGPILGQGFTGTTSVSLNGTPASFTVESDTLIKATVPAGATTGYVTVATPSGTLTSNVPFHVIP